MDQINKLFNRKFEGVVWSVNLSENADELILDLRREDEKEVEYLILDLDTFEVTKMEGVRPSWWSNIEFYDGTLFISEYLDSKDPSAKKYFQVRNNEKNEIEEPDIPTSTIKTSQPFIYEQGSDYHKTVSNFLNEEISCSCEYLEMDDKIIISYYLRSGKEFDRYLLVLKAGSKVIAKIQDSGMKGFAAGAFFVTENKLFFIRNRNEVCIYSI